MHCDCCHNCSLVFRRKVCVCVCWGGGGGCYRSRWRVERYGGMFCLFIPIPFRQDLFKINTKKHRQFSLLILTKREMAKMVISFFSVDLDKTGIGENNYQFSLLILTKRKLAKMIISFVLFLLLSVLILTKLELSKIIINFLC